MRITAAKFVFTSITKLLHLSNYLYILSGIMGKLHCCC
jgi:hypothetical protein